MSRGGREKGTGEVALKEGREERGRGEGSIQTGLEVISRSVYTALCQLFTS